jgi:hypothetical protein
VDRHVLVHRLHEWQRLEQGVEPLQPEVRGQRDRRQREVGEAHAALSPCGGQQEKEDEREGERHPDAGAEARRAGEQQGVPGDGSAGGQRRGSGAEAGEAVEDDEEDRRSHHLAVD